MNEAERASSRAPRLDPLAVRRLLRDEGLRARHSLSQNFLADPDVLEAILVEADAASGDRILEIGPGLGILTEALLAVGAAVTAVELDWRLAALVRKRLNDAVNLGTGDPWTPGALRLIEGDALAAPQGRAEDVFVGARCDFDDQSSIRLGYRILEGGADNDEVYNFALIQYLVGSVVVRF